MQIIPVLYHGCNLRNEDGTNVLIDKDYCCIYPTRSPFWKDTKDVTNCVLTRLQKKKQTIATLRDQYVYFRNNKHKI